MDPTPKYRQMGLDPIDGVPMNWRAHPDGFPTRNEHSGGPYIEREKQQAASEILYARSKFFMLPEENDKYQEVLDWIANGMAFLRHEKHREMDGGKWQVWLVYIDVRGYIPKDSELSEMLGRQS